MTRRAVGRAGMVRRALVATSLLLLLGGPTPGAVGSCGEESAPLVDLVDYCVDRELLSCRRRQLRGELNDDTYADCADDVVRVICPSRFWAPGCRPTTRQANACIEALRSYDTLQIEERDLPECKVSALCTIEMQPSDASMRQDGGMP